MAKKPSGNPPSGVVNEVIRRIQKRERPERTKRTLILTKTTYDEFEKICRGLGKYPSDLVDEFIALVVEQKKGGT